MNISRNISGLGSPKFYSNNHTVQAEFTKGFGDGAIAERQRLVSMMALPEAVGREGVLNHLMFNTSVSPEEARILLSGVARAKVQVNDLFAQAMSAIPNPGISVDSEESEGSDLSASVRGILGAANMMRNASGADLKKGS
jgi:hypothetical protein